MMQIGNAKPGKPVPENDPRQEVIRVGLFLPKDAYIYCKVEAAKRQITMSQFVTMLILRDKK